MGYILLFFKIFFFLISKDTIKSDSKILYIFTEKYFK